MKLLEYARKWWFGDSPRDATTVGDLDPESPAFTFYGPAFPASLAFVFFFGMISWAALMHFIGREGW